MSSMAKQFRPALCASTKNSSKRNWRRCKPAPNIGSSHAVPISENAAAAFISTSIMSISSRSSRVRCSKHSRESVASSHRCARLFPRLFRYEYRNRITVHAREGVIGFFRRESNELLDIAVCPISRRVNAQPGRFSRAASSRRPLHFARPRRARASSRRQTMLSPH